MNQLDCRIRYKYQRFRYELQNTRHHQHDHPRPCRRHDRVYLDGQTFDQKSLYLGRNHLWFNACSYRFLYNHLPCVSYWVRTSPHMALGEVFLTNAICQLALLIDKSADV